MYPRNMVFSDCIVIQGSNMAECHPVAFRWPMQAKLNGAKIIHGESHRILGQHPEVPGLVPQVDVRQRRHRRERFRLRLAPH